MQGRLRLSTRPLWLVVVVIGGVGLGACSSGAAEDSSHITAPNASSPAISSSTSTTVGEPVISLDPSEERFAEELAVTFDATPLPEGVLDRGPSLCAARFWVFHIGIERLEALGLTPGSMTAEQSVIAISQIPQDEARAIQEAFQAVCFRDVMVSSLVQQLGITTEESECLYDAMMSDEVTKWVWTDPSIGDSPDFQTSFQTKLAACT